MIETIILGAAVFGAASATITAVCAFRWYRIVPPSEAHLVVTPKGKIVVSPDDVVATNKQRTYYKIPSSIPVIGRSVREMDVTIKEVVVDQETYEINQARYNVRSSTKYRIEDVVRAAETFTNTRELEQQLKEVIQAAVRAVTIKYDVTQARSKKQDMEEAIREEMTDDLAAWGLRLVNFQLVDFSDTNESSIISDISKRREVEIQTTTREQNAEKEKIASIKEAAATEASEQREIEKLKVIGEQEQLKAQKIAEMEKVAEEKRYEVVQVQAIKQAEIDKEKAIIKAEERKATTEIEKETKRLEGEGDRIRDEQKALGEAAPIREKILAEAEGKEKLQQALNKFTPAAITALTAEQIVNMQKDVGIATASALEYADVRLFAGGKDGESGFNLAQMVSSAQLGNEELGKSILNKMARPNDLGFTGLTIPVLTRTLKDKKDILVKQKETVIEPEQLEKIDTQIGELNSVLTQLKETGPSKAVSDVMIQKPNDADIPGPRFYSEEELRRMGL